MLLERNFRDILRGKRKVEKIHIVATFYIRKYIFCIVYIFTCIFIEMIPLNNCMLLVNYMSFFSTP